MTKPPGPPIRRLRRLSEEEIDLWLTVAERVQRRPESRLPDRVRAAAPKLAEAPPIRLVPAPPPKRSASPPPMPLAPLERRLKQKLSRGRMTADAAIDLHGLRQDEAYRALRAFLHRAQGDGATVVIVVTGKGGRPGVLGDATFGDGIGVLRRAVPLWLAMPELRLLVVGFEEAARHHGGSGALYVRLRRPRGLG